VASEAQLARRLWQSRRYIDAVAGASLATQPCRQASRRPLRPAAVLKLGRPRA